MHIDIQVDSWWASYASKVEDIKEEFPHLIPVDLGSMGYEGEESMYVTKDVLQQALDAEGLDLDYYRGCSEQSSCNLYVFEDSGHLTPFVVAVRDAAPGRLQSDTP